jgi:hypothetical protein
MIQHRIYIVMMICTAVGLSKADCPYAHTHIGINPTWQPDWSAPGDPSLATDTDPTDDNKLWFFSLPPVHGLAPTPGWPNWEQSNGGVFLLLTQVFDNGQAIVKGDGSGKELWTCDFLYSQSGGYGDTAGLQHINGWHSAHGPQGKWNLESVDQNTTPAWNINLRREGSSLAEDDLLFLDSNDQQILTNDGDTYPLTKQWLTDKSAWGMHVHMGFYFWLEPDFNDTVSVTLSAFDTGGLYDRSADFTIQFAKEVCVPVTGDLNNDCVVDLQDLSELAENWLKNGWNG